MSHLVIVYEIKETMRQQRKQLQSRGPKLGLVLDATSSSKPRRGSGSDVCGPQKKIWSWHYHEKHRNTDGNEILLLANHILPR